MKSAEVKPRNVYWIPRYNCWGQVLKKRQYMFAVLLNKPPWGAWLNANELYNFAGEEDIIDV